MSQAPVGRTWLPKVQVASNTRPSSAINEPPLPGSPLSPGPPDFFPPPVANIPTFCCSRQFPELLFEIRTCGAHVQVRWWPRRFSDRLIAAHVSAHESNMSRVGLPLQRSTLTITPPYPLSFVAAATQKPYPSSSSYSSP